MDPELQSVLLMELDGQCNNARFALRFMRESAELAIAGQNHQPFWFGVQGWLAAVANISKILYPTKMKYAPRGNYLRALLGEAVTTPFDVASRRMRNNYEHFDERIEVDWWTSPNRRSFRADYNFYPVGDLEACFGAVNCFRNYDANTETLTFMGQDFPIQPIEEAVTALQQAIAQHS